MNKSRPLRGIVVVCCALLIACLPFGSLLTTSSADGTAQTLPLTQNWSNTAQITAADDWNGVPGIVGYRGDDLTTAIGADPQTILADGSATPVDVNANQSNPDTFTSGGVAEFEIANPVVALNGSGTADAPHLVINLNTTGQSGITASYNLRDLDGSADNSVQAVALQYRVGNAGSYTNIAAGFVADATSGPGQATQVTPVNVALPAAVNNQPLVQLRIITTNANGNDEWVGVDDLLISVGGTIPLGGFGAASPSIVQPGNNSLLTVSVTPATEPPSTGINVAANLTGIGGATMQPFFDNGTNGDVTPNDNVFSYLATVSMATGSGQQMLPAVVTDAQLRVANVTITLTVQSAATASDHLAMGNPSNATADVANGLNYLMMKPQYALAYHKDKGTANWVSWHLDSTWIGDAPRQDDYRADTQVPDGWYRVQGTDYSGSGFDRGHYAPSADRTRSIPDNSATFLMTNMMPQAPDNNQGPWEQLESYSRSLVGQGNELYVIMGGAGVGGTGSNGGVTMTIANGHVTVPAYTWKVIVVLPVGDNDAARVNKHTRTIAVIMPNTQGIRTTPWRNFRVSVRQVEALTGYNFLSNVPRQVQAAVERAIDRQ